MADTGYTFWNKEIDRLKDGKITSDEFDKLMEKLMEQEM